MSKLIGKASLFFVLLLTLLLAGCQTGSAGGTPATRPPTRPESRTTAHQRDARRALRILVTNDDGIGSPGLRALVSELKTLGEVVVVAPDGNRSGASHSVTSLSARFRVEERKIPGASRALAMSGTPADAVNFALATLGKEKRFDVVVSGINRGANVGLVAHYSGTVGAAMEAVYQGVPGIAISADKNQTDHGIGARFARSFVAMLMKEGAPPGVGYNINIPGGPKEQLRGVVVAPMGGSFINVNSYERVTKAEGLVYRARAVLPRKAPAGSDTEAFFQGKITVAPIRLDWTDKQSLDRLRKWKLTVQ